MSFKGQGALELLILFAAGMLALIVVVAVLPSQAIGTQTLRDRQAARETVSLISSAADEVYLSGDGAVKNIWIAIPQTARVQSSFIGARAGETNWSLRKTVLLNLTNEGDIFSISRAPMCGSWPATSGRYQIRISYNSSAPAHVMVNSNC